MLKIVDLRWGKMLYPHTHYSIGIVKGKGISLKFVNYESQAITEESS